MNYQSMAISLSFPSIDISDIVMSLEWVQSNIEAYGGDPKSVTLFGHSFGGHTVTALAFSPVINKDQR